MPDKNAVHLSPREREVCALVIEGLQDKQIASRLKLQESTVGSYLDRIYRKLTQFEVKNRARLVRWCLVESDLFHTNARTPAKTR